MPSLIFNSFIRKDDRYPVARQPLTKRTARPASPSKGGGSAEMRGQEG